MMPLDECLAYPATESRLKNHLSRTTDGKKIVFKVFNNRNHFTVINRNCFVSFREVLFKDLRKRSIEEFLVNDFNGCAIGGLAVGEKNDLMYDTYRLLYGLIAEINQDILWVSEHQSDILESVESGVDMFDCVMPTRNARHGRIFTTYGEINIKNAKYANDFRFD